MDTLPQTPSVSFPCIMHHIPVKLGLLVFCCTVLPVKYKLSRL